MPKTFKKLKRRSGINKQYQDYDLITKNLYNIKFTDEGKELFIWSTQDRKWLMMKARDIEQGAEVSSDYFYGSEC